MTKTIRILLPALLLTLCTACTNELTTTPATDNPLVLEHVYIGTPTKAEPYNPGFVNGSTLEATLTLGEMESKGTYTYKDGVWKAHTPAYWQNTREEHTLTLQTPEPSTMPAEGFTTDNWHTYDILTYTGQATPGTTDFPLTHTRAQLCVTLTPGETMADADLTGATIKVNGCGMLHKDGAYYALLNPTPTPTLTITYKGDTYTYTPETDILTEGQCTMLKLALNKTGVSGISVSNEEWQNVTGTVTEETGWTTHTGGSLDASTLTGKVLITGTLTDADMTALNGAKDRITHLYITAESNAWGSLVLGRSDNKNNTMLESVYMPKATSIGDNAFAYCQALTTISLPEATEIGDHAFQGCTNLTNVNLPKVTDIGPEAFFHCEGLTTISLPKATNIERQAFDGCYDLTTITLSPKTYIGPNAFYYCTSLHTLRLPDLTKEDFEADESKYTSFGGVTWEHIYYYGGEWHRQ